MSHLVLSREIYRPLAEVFAYHTDLMRAPQWWSNLTEVIPVEAAPGPAAEGARYRVVYNMIGRRFAGEILVTEVAPQERLRFEVSGSVRASFRYEYTATARTRTRVTVYVEYEARGLFGRAFDRLFVERRNAADAEHALDALKDLLEAEVMARVDAGVV